jgi:hypothetical protein
MINAAMRPMQIARPKPAIKRSGSGVSSSSTAHDLNSVHSSAAECGGGPCAVFPSGSSALCRSAIPRCQVDTRMNPYTINARTEPARRRLTHAQARARCLSSSSRASSWPDHDTPRVCHRFECQARKRGRGDDRAAVLARYSAVARRRRTSASWAGRQSTPVASRASVMSVEWQPKDESLPSTSVAVSGEVERHTSPFGALTLTSKRFPTG